MIYIDFEFSKITQEKVELVCCCVYDDTNNVARSFWLHKDDKAKKLLFDFLKNNILEVFNAYAVTAEARSFISLGLDPMNFDWIDSFIEYRMVTNNNNNLIVGKHYLNGKFVNVPAPKMKCDRTADDKGYKLNHSLIEATYRLTGELRNLEEKQRMRDLIISDPVTYTEQQKTDILKYCMEDVVHLPKILERIYEEYEKVLSKKDYRLLKDEMLLRGKYTALTAIRESKGYPIDYDKTRNFSKAVPLILEETQREINSLFPEIKPFKYDRLEKKFKENQKQIRLWIESKYSDWKRTDPTARNPNGQISLKLEEWERKFYFRHDYPKDNFGAQMLRYGKLKQALNGFSTGKNSKSFWDNVGVDKRVRPYMNPYGAQTGRTQAAASGFLFLKPAWCRALMMPAKGKAIVSIDYGSEEFLISALLSNDKKMMKAYASGDVYLAFGKECGMIPKDGTKDSHKFERDLCKSTVLGLSYKMSKYGLAAKLSQDLNKEFTTDEAQDLIDSFYDVYEDFKEWQDDLINNYGSGEISYIKTLDGWTHFGDNPNFRSVANVPVQGAGSAIMRKADLLCYEKGLYAPFTLHDAIYIEIDSDRLQDIDTFLDCMKEGFTHYFPDQLEYASKIRLDAYAWSPDYEVDSELITPKNNKIECSNIYIDPRSQKEYDQFSKYFEKHEIDL